MAQTLTDQIITIERALGERMIDHALIILRAWMNELGENNPYEQAYSDIEEQYNKLFTEWLTSDDPKGDEILDGLTGDTYRLTDAVYLDIRLKRGIAPEMHGFNKQSHQSILQYFSVCPSGSPLRTISLMRSIAFTRFDLPDAFAPYTAANFNSFSLPSSYI